MKRLSLLFTGLLILLSAFLTQLLTAESARAAYPDRGINVILPFGPGGATDMLTRVFDVFAKEVFGQNLIVVYKPGAGSAVGTTSIAKSRSDGYTIGMGSLPHMFLQPAAGSGRYTLDDFDYICLFASDPQLIITPKSSPYKTYADLKAAAQKTPGKLTLGIPSPLSESWLAYELINAKEKLGFTVVVYQGGGDLNAAILGNQIDAAVVNPGVVFGEIDKMNVLGVTAPERLEYLPDVPTFKEQGVDVENSVERIFMAPKGVKPEQLNVLREGFKKIWHNPEFQKKCADMRFCLKWIDGEDVRAYLDEKNKEAVAIYKTTRQ